MLRGLVLVLGRVLHRKPYIWFYYKEWAHVTVEAKSQATQSASWGPRRADGIISSPRAGRLKIQERLMFLEKPQILAGTVRQEESPLRRPFCPSLLFDWMRTICIRGCSLFNSVH